LKVVTEVNTRNYIVVFMAFYFITYMLKIMIMWVYHSCGHV